MVTLLLPDAPRISICFSLVVPKAHHRKPLCLLREQAQHPLSSFVGTNAYRPPCPKLSQSQALCGVTPHIKKRFPFSRTWEKELRRCYLHHKRSGKDNAKTGACA